MTNTIRLWSLRWSTARGWSYTMERECLTENAEAWLQFFQKVEPTIKFVFSAKKPKIK